MARSHDRTSYDSDGDTSPVEMEAPIGDLSSPKTSFDPKAVDDVVYSEIGINVLLTRLKQSIASARDFAVFLKKRSSLEDDHAQGLKKLSRTTFDATRRHDAKQGSYAAQLSDLSRAHERMADHGIQFALSLGQMHDDLTELSNNIERGRKHWKQEGLSSEKRVKDAESTMEKAKSRYDSLAEDYDRARTGDRSGGRVFTVKGPKSAERHEEDLNRKLQASDADYAAKVQGAQAARQENISTARPQAVRALQELIKECDAGLTLHLQKFAAFNEKLLVGNGMVVSPVKDGPGAEGSGGPLSLREMVHSIDNERDFQHYVVSHTSNVPSRPPEIRYEKHPTLAPSQQAPTQLSGQRSQTMDEDRLTGSRQPSSTVRSQTGPAVTPLTQSPRQPSGPSAISVQTSPAAATSPYAYQSNTQQPTPERSFRGPPSDQYAAAPQPPQSYQSGQPAIQNLQTGPPLGQNAPTGVPISQQYPQTIQSTLPVYSQMQQSPQQYQASPHPPQPPQQQSQSGMKPTQQQFSGEPQSGQQQFSLREQISRPPQGGPPLQTQQQQPPAAQRYQSPVIPQLHQSPQATNGPFTESGPTFGAKQPQSQPPAQLQSMSPALGAANGAYNKQQSMQQQARPPQPPAQQQQQGRTAQAPTKSVFGITLDALFRRDESPVPMVVYQCIQAIDLFGLNTEGIYRLSGNAAHISQLKALFDSSESSRVDFRNPENFQHDVNSVAGLLKQFFKDLPDPLLTTEFYNDFIDAARVDDDNVRRDSLHAVINSLPDPNYATLRALTLHLYRVQEHSQTNRMSSTNLAICLAPTIMGQHRGPHMADAGLQARVLDTIVQNTYAIFDED